MREHEGFSSDQEHIQLLLARLGAAQRALVAEITHRFGVSESVAQVLARMGINEVVGGSGEEGDLLVPAYPNDSYCRQCWALVAPDTECWRQGELFDACSACGQAASNEQEAA